MKGKITIVLLSLVLVFGMIAASCDNGTQPANPYPPATQTGPNTTTASDYKPSEADPSNIIAKKIKAINALAGGIKLGVYGSNSPVWDADNKVVKVTGSSSSAFSITFADLPATTPPTTWAATDKVKITYALVIEEQQNADGEIHLTTKKGHGSWDTIAGNPQYPHMLDTSKVTVTDKTTVTVETKTLTITIGSGDPTTGIAFQHNNYDGVGGVYYIKVTKVEKDT